MVVVLPWHVKPVRVAESIAMLDILCEGRLILGIGRGLGKIEFDGLGVPMGESRGRFIESAEIILNGLEQGWVEYDGEFFQQPKRWLRPAPEATFKGRTFAAAVSPESSEIMAKLGLGIMVIPQKPWDTTKEDLANYSDTFRRVNGVDAPPTKMLCPVFVDEDEGRARDLGIHYIGKYYHMVLKHYDLAGTHFAGVTGYEHYARGATEMQRRGEDNAAEFYAGLQVYGTPDQCVEKIAERKEILGSDTFIGTFSYSGIEWDDVERNVRLFMDKVQPRVKAM
jgi:alkanesulfonate monooxygenase SsuD/methylene tetrahydromethanopterin reductase-like flavin-dependent oxidoreductase (luciferase family)